MKRQITAEQAGLIEHLLRGFSAADAVLAARIQHVDDLRSALETLALLYSQTTNRTKLIIGWAAIEELFSASPEHVLNEQEKSELLAAVRSAGAIATDIAKLGKVEQVLKDPNLMAKQTKNDRMAQAIAELTGVAYPTVRARIGLIARCRGTMAHSSLDETAEIEEGIAYLSNVLEIYTKTRFGQELSAPD